MSDPAFSVRRAHWPRDAAALRLLRQRVFIEEQQVPQELEWDGEDEQALHLLALDPAQNPIGTARLLPSGQIGRMAVLQDWRKRGVGSALLARMLEEAARGDYPGLFLHAQLSALPFYERQGFEAQGEVFYEADIPHKRMKINSRNG